MKKTEALKHWQVQIKVFFSYSAQSEAIFSPVLFTQWIPLLKWIQLKPDYLLTVPRGQREF